MTTNYPDSSSGSTPDIGVELMVHVARGDTDAFQQLVESYQSLVFALLRRILGPNAAIEDVAQEAFVRVWNNRDNYQARGKFSTYLYRITYNLALNKIRDSKRKPLPSMPRD
ncbi:MAG: sigma-70 family RNA polymerase sigma factor, partial [Planctomycetota bacterium]|nr:sigma-70 family RNA polymerase sigma factor [Planctomycetota bacterium]